MTVIDWIVLLGTLTAIVAFGIWRTRGSRNIQGFLLGNKSQRWWTIGLSVMATQASAITFLSTPGQGFESGMGFVQFYFGLPIAMIIISVFFIPLYYKLKVYTAYEYLERRFDKKLRLLTALLFLVQRGLAAGLTIYAPAIILSHILSVSLTATILLIGGLVILYTVSGGTNAVSQTHKTQMFVIFLGMFIAFGLVITYLSEYLSFQQTLTVAGKLGKLEVVDLSFDTSSRYNIWAGILGGLFLQLSYFGTDQSQVQRYLSGQSIKESRLGLMFNGILKIPMQFFILLIGVLVFMFYQFYQPPVYFNQASLQLLENSEYKDELKAVKNTHAENFQAKKAKVQALVAALEEGNVSSSELNERVSAIKQHLAKRQQLDKEVAGLIEKAAPDAKTENSDYVFLNFVVNYLPTGIVGLLLAVIFSAAMSSTAAELNALASTTTVDLYKRNRKAEQTDKHLLQASRIFTVLFGGLAITFALTASLFENLIEAINILGSLFYGTILGIFLVAFFIRNVGANATFIAALLAESLVLALYYTSDIGYLWFNFIGCTAVTVLSLLIQYLGLRLQR